LKLQQQNIHNLFGGERRKNVYREQKEQSESGKCESGEQHVHPDGPAKITRRPIVRITMTSATGHCLLQQSCFRNVGVRSAFWSLATKPANCRQYKSATELVFTSGNLMTYQSVVDFFFTGSSQTDRLFVTACAFFKNKKRTVLNDTICRHVRQYQKMLPVGCDKFVWKVLEMVKLSNAKLSEMTEQHVKATNASSAIDRD
jgi:hypothetical protein